MEQEGKKPLFMVHEGDSTEGIQAWVSEKSNKFATATVEDVGFPKKQARYSETLEEKLLEFHEEPKEQEEEKFPVISESEEQTSDDVSTILEEPENIQIAEADNSPPESKPEQTTEIEKQNQENETVITNEETKPEKKKQGSKLIYRPDKPRRKDSEVESDNKPKLTMSKLLFLARKDFESSESDSQQTELILAQESLSADKFAKKKVSIDVSKKASSGMHETKFSTFDVEEQSLDTFDSAEKKLKFEDEDKDGEDMVKTPKGMRFEYGRCPKTCERFLNIKEYAKTFVGDIIESAMDRERSLRQQSSTKIIEGIEYVTSDSQKSSITSIGTYVCILEWPPIEQFTIEVGTNKIQEYVSYWKFEEDWKYCINYLQGDSDAACDFYRYEAIFSIPCKQYPIPQATASVYFTFEVSRIRPIHCLVDVYYWFEGQRSIHKPGNFTFQEVQLFNIVDAKIKFYKTLRF